MGPQVGPPTTAKAYPAIAVPRFSGVPGHVSILHNIRNRFAHISASTPPVLVTAAAAKVPEKKRVIKTV